jgi:uncharacterized protein DUF6602
MPLLDDRFSNIDQQPSAKLRDARRSTRHDGIRGDELSGALGEIVKSHFVDCASYYEKCEVTDTHGSLSNEVDLVFLNHFHPAFLLKDRPRAFFIEGVLAAAEVKTSLDKSETIDCLQKAQAFKRLLPRVEGNDLQTHNVEAEDWSRYLLRRPFFAFAYEDTRRLSTIHRNIEEWINAHQIPDVEQIDAFFIRNKGIIVNLGSGSGTLEIRDANGDLLSGFVRNETTAVFSQLILWLSSVCPTFTSLHPILLRYMNFSTAGFVK